MTDFVLEGRGYYRCKQCRVDAVHRKRKKNRDAAISKMGGACVICRYDKFSGALDFHHLQPSDKEFTLSGSSTSLSVSRIMAEAGKCILLCANCHRELHAGVASLTSSERAPQPGQ